MNVRFPAAVALVICPVLLAAGAPGTSSSSVRSTAPVADASAVAVAPVGETLTLGATTGDIDVTVRTVETTRDGGRVIIADRVDGLGRAIIATRAGVMAGYLVGEGGTWRLHREAGGAIFRPAPTGFDCSVGDDVGFAPAALAAEAARPAAASDAASGGDICPFEGVFHDLLVVYTDNVVATWGGEAATLAEIDAVVALSNVALENSDTTPRFRLALAWPLDAPDGISLGQLTNPGDGVADEVHVLRNLVAADQVTMLFDGGGGVANGVVNFESDQEARAFNRSGINSFPYVFPHELGHNMGCCHAFGDGGGCPSEGGLLFPFSNGHRWFGDSGTEWRTIMAYSPGERTDHFSNPNIDFDGVPTGLEDADNALTMALSQDFVAQFRCSSTAMCGDLDDAAALDDCNDNGFPDGCDIGTGLSVDANGNGVPDECEPCTPDFDGSGAVDAGDLAQLLAAWGSCGDCVADLDGDGDVGAADLALLLAAWGDCV